MALIYTLLLNNLAMAEGERFSSTKKKWKKEKVSEAANFSQS